MAPRWAGPGRWGLEAGPRAGFSLMELFLVIAILSVISLVTFPLLRRPLNESVVQDAGQQLMRDLANARMQAITAGQPIVFQFQPGTGRYYIGAVDQRLESAALADSSAASAESSDAAYSREDDGRSGRSKPESFAESRASPGSIGQRELTAEVMFVDRAAERRNEGLDVGPPASARRKETPRSARGDGKPLDETQSFTEPRSEGEPGGLADQPAWSVPIRFYPSGRIKPATVTLQSPAGVRVELVIQGIAGRIKLMKLKK